MAKLVAVGTCKSCGKQFVRPASCTHAACNCTSVHEVPLTPALLLAPRYRRKLEQVSKHSGLPVQQLLDALLKEVSAQLMRGLETQKKDHPSVQWK